MQIEQESIVDRMTDKRIFIGLSDIAGYYGHLARGLRIHGLSTTQIVINRNKYHPEEAQTNQEMNRYIRMLQAAQSRYQHCNATRKVRKAWWLIVRELLTMGMLVWALPRFDVFIIAVGHSFVRGNYDLWLMKRLGKRIIVNLGHGSEARPPYMNGALPDRILNNRRVLKVWTEYTARKVRRCVRLADVVIGTPYTAQFINKKFVNFLVLGIPVKLNAADAPETADPEGRVRILHSPTNPKAKGTPLIREAIAKLETKGRPIDFVEITNMKHARVIEELVRCDFVIDQVYSDVLMAGFATEAACVGKPAVVGGHDLKALRESLNPDVRPPVIICHPDDLEQAIDLLITEVDYRLRIGAEALRFIQRYNTPEKFAERYVRILEGNCPDSWFAEPGDYCYTAGFGMTRKQVGEKVRLLVDAYGTGSLQLGRRTDIVTKLLEVTGGT